MDSNPDLTAEPDSSAAEPDQVSAPGVSLAEAAYNLMVRRIDGDFTPWGELPDNVRGAFKSRAATVESLPAFERAVAELAFSPAQ